MSPRKLTTETKQEILKLYRETEATTSTLAEHYEVSSSTISRFLKSSLSESEYEDLIQQKRLGRTSKMQKETTPVEEVEEKIPERSAAPTPKPISRRKLDQKAVNAEVPQEIPNQQLNLFEPEEEEEEEESVDVIALGEIFGEDLVDLDEDEDDLDEDEDWGDEIEPQYAPAFSADSSVQVLPFSAVSLPKTCYLVIDRAAELIVRPLKEFADLGSIPPEEIQQKTLPIFDNHRVARRFSNRSQRVIKVPDSKIIPKTRSYLTAKGITRLLMNGKIYSLFLS